MKKRSLLLVLFSALTLSQAHLSSLSTDPVDRAIFIKEQIASKLTRGETFLRLFSNIKQLCNTLTAEERRATYASLFGQWTRSSILEQFYRSADLEDAQNILKYLPKDGRLSCINAVLHELLLAHSIPHEDHEQSADLLFLALLHFFSDEQVLEYMKASLKNQRSPFAFDYPYLNSANRQKFERIFLVITRKGPVDLLELFTFRTFPHLSQDKKDTLSESLTHTYDPSAEYSPSGPLFSHYTKSYPQADVCIRTMPSYAPNFSGLLPLLAEYVAEQYAQGYTVFFHGQSSFWIFYQELYKTLYLLTRKKPLHAFLPLRFTQHSLITAADLTNFHQQGKWTNPTLKGALLWVNLHPAANHSSANSLYYATQNYDQSIKDNNLNEELVQQTFSLFGLQERYEQFKKQNPAFLSETKALFDDAIKEQGNYGQLVVISLRQELASRIAYYTNTNDQYNKTQIYSLSASSPVVASQKFDDIPFLNEWLLILTEDIVNPEAAAIAQVRIVGFDPVRYWRTEKWMVVEKKLEQLRHILAEAA